MPWPKVSKSQEDRPEKGLVIDKEGDVEIVRKMTVVLEGFLRLVR